VDALDRQLQRIKNLAGNEKPENSIGVLTSENRTVWAEARQLLIQNPANQTNLRRLEATLFGVCLDDKVLPQGVELERNYWHSDGKNRFFDKSFQFIVMENGAVGLNGEHTGVDGSPAWRMVNYVIERERELAKNPALMGSATDQQQQLPTPQELVFTTTPELNAAIQRATNRLAQHASEVDLQILYFKAFGKEQIKKWKVSPDAFCQMAMQLAVYGLTGQFYPTYESGQTRKFLHGRTETVRSVSAESVAWVKAMHSNGVPNAERLKLFQAACKRHVQTNQEAVEGLGIDRHLLGMRLLASELGLEMPQLYKDPAYFRTCTWRLSTSQLSSPYFQVVFGPVVEDGIGSCYGILDDSLHFKASTALKCAVNASQFCGTVERSLLQMAALCESGAADQKKARL